jgi:hypothetical protein
MQEAGLRGCVRGCRKRTTRRSGRAVVAKDFLQRSFAATQIDKEVTLGRVGIVLSSEVTRLSRNCSEWYPLL